MGGVQLICNIPWGVNCGRPISQDEVAEIAGVLTPTVQQFFQCSNCAAEQKTIRQVASSNGQDKWRERRGRATLREAAEVLGLSIIDYSSMESLRAVAPAAVRAKFNQRFRESSR